LRLRYPVDAEDALEALPSARIAPAVVQSQAANRSASGMDIAGLSNSSATSTAGSVKSAVVVHVRREPERMLGSRKNTRQAEEQPVRAPERLGARFATEDTSGASSGSIRGGACPE
jgi:hypothetical protein